MSSRHNSVRQYTLGEFAREQERLHREMLREHLREEKLNSLKLKVKKTLEMHFFFFFAKPPSLPQSGCINPFSCLDPQIKMGIFQADSLLRLFFLKEKQYTLITENRAENFPDIIYLFAL